MISTPLQQLCASLAKAPARSDWSDYQGPRFVTSKAASSVGSLYEKLRYVVDNQEEHMIRRVAIERIIRRLLRFSPNENIGRNVLEELVLGCYIENDVLPESFASDIHNIIVNYYKLSKLVPKGGEVLWSYAAIDIERTLFPYDEDEYTFLAVFQSVVQYVHPKEQGVLSPETFHLHLYIACRRLLLRESHATLNYSLFRMMVPGWLDRSLDDEVYLQTVADRFARTQMDIKDLVSEPIQWKIMSRLKNENIYFRLINEIVRKYGVESTTIFSDKERLNELVTKFLERTYTTHREKIRLSGNRAVIYIFITKTIIGMSVELPYEIFILGHVFYPALAINILFFPLLLLVMVKTVKYPGEENTERVVKGLQSFIRGENQKNIYVKIAPKTLLQKISYLTFFSIFFFFTFGVVIYLLDLAKFNPASIGLFIFFLCIVTYMGLRIRHKSQEWTLAYEDESIRGLVWFLIVLPVTRSGRWLATQLSTMNIFVFFMDFILETPFKLLLGSFDSFVSFVKESRRDEM